MKKGRPDSILPKILNISNSANDFFKTFYFPENCNITTAAAILKIKKGALWAWMKRNNIQTKSQSISQSGNLNGFAGHQHSPKTRINIGRASKKRQPQMTRGKYGRYGSDGKFPFGPGNPTWKTGDSHHFYKRIIVERGSMCEQCGNSKKIAVHHKDKDRKNNSTENLEVLCVTCHHKEHPKKRNTNGQFSK